MRQTKENKENYTRLVKKDIEKRISCINARTQLCKCAYTLTEQELLTVCVY